MMRSRLEAWDGQAWGPVEPEAVIFGRLYRVASDLGYWVPLSDPIQWGTGLRVVEMAAIDLFDLLDLESARDRLAEVAGAYIENARDQGFDAGPTNAAEVIAEMDWTPIEKAVTA